MKRTLLTLGFMLTFVLAAMAEKTYVISAETVTAFGSANAYGITVSNNGGKSWASGKENTLKYSVGVAYNIKLPAEAKITKVEIKGYDNYADGDSYLSAINTTTYGATDYVFPAKDASGNYTMVTRTVSLASAITGSMDITFAGKQVCAIITLYSDEETKPAEVDDSYSRGYYSSPSTGAGLAPTGASKVFSYPTPASMMEKLDRGVVVLPAMSKGNTITWRLLGTDAANTTFDVLKNDAVVKADLDKVTNYTDAQGTTADSYVVVTKVNGVETERSAAVKPWNRIYKTVQLDRPKDTRGQGCEYTPNDMSVGDLDGDGQYEIIVKWNPTNAKDNSQTGVTGTVYIDAYRMDGTKLWRVDLGKNIRAGAHYTQFLVYDFDGDGKAEMICKTAPGSKDGNGNYVSAAGTDAKITAVDNSKQCYNSNGHPTSGEEFLTVFNGETGAAMHTIWYNPPRSGVVGGTGATTYGKWESVQGKSTNYNRGERYNATVAYLNGQDALPSAVMQRGYYTYAFLWAVDWDGKALSTRWVHYGDSKTTWKTYDASNKQIFSGSGKSSFGQGVHGISCGDVDGDGFDEIVIGSATIDHDGQLLCSTGKGHGDAIHLSDLDPDREGLEIMMPHEESPYGYDVHDAATGELIISKESSGDNGRGLAADVVSSNRGFEFWSSASSDVWSVKTKQSLGTKRPSVNFRVYWDGDLQDELFDGHYSSSGTQTDLTGTCSAAIEKLKSTTSFATLLNLSGEAYGNGRTNNTTKATPSLIADLFGDWREEIILWDGKDPSVINIYSSNVTSVYRVPTLMHDHVYRMGITWQNSSYNQPAHLGYYLPDMFDRNYGIYSEAYATGIKTAEAATIKGGAMFSLSGQRISEPVPGQIYLKNGKKYIAK